MNSIDWLSGLGAFGFGALIGWYVYYINRYRKGDVQLSDLATIVTVLAGAGITAVFDPKTQLFGAYGIGLFIGFFSYFIVLIVLVRNSGGAFTWTWFLDGRRRKIDPQTEEVPEHYDATARSFDVEAAPPQELSVGPAQPPQVSFDVQAEPSQPHAEAVSLLNELIEQQRIARRAGEDAQRELARLILAEKDDAQCTELKEKQDVLSESLKKLRDQQLKDVFKSDAVTQALANLRQVNALLQTEANRMKNATDAIARAAKVIGYVQQAMGLVTKALAA